MKKLIKNFLKELKEDEELMKKPVNYNKMVHARSLTQEEMQARVVPNKTQLKKIQEFQKKFVREEKDPNIGGWHFKVWEHPYQIIEWLSKALKDAEQQGREGAISLIKKKKVKWIKGKNIYEVENGVNINIINTTLDDILNELKEKINE